MVSALTLSSLTTWAAMALLSNASFSWSTACCPAPGGDLHERGGVGHRIGDPDATEAPPGHGVSDLGTQGLEAEPIPEAQEHHPQVGLHRDRRPTDLRIEERHERFEEHRVVEQAIHLLQPWWEALNSGGRIASHSVC